MIIVNKFVMYIINILKNMCFFRFRTNFIEWSPSWNETSYFELKFTWSEIFVHYY